MGENYLNDDAAGGGDRVGVEALRLAAGTLLLYEPGASTRWMQSDVALDLRRIR